MVTTFIEFSDPLVIIQDNQNCIFWGGISFFIRTYQKVPIVQHYTCNTIKTNNYMYIYHVHT